ncbi:MAG: hypothetical protein CMJ58_12430 [Planctomycetaceae bacterium]|nr:hypothetical protein [Planctomycetaceae bacterium]
MRGKDGYQWITTSDEGFVRYLVANILPHGYRFYTAGMVKPTTDLAHFDAVMEEKYCYRMSRSARWRRKAATTPAGTPMNLGNVHYLRRDRFYILIATAGSHPFFRHNVTETRDRHGRLLSRRKHFRDAHRDPIFFDGYSIRIDCEGGYRPRRLWADPEVPEWDGRPRVRVAIQREVMLTIRADFIARARSARWSATVLESEVRKLPYLRYAPVRQQLRSLVLAMNRERAKRGLSDRLDPKRCISSYIPAVGPFDRIEADNAASGAA